MLNQNSLIGFGNAATALRYKNSPHYVATYDYGQPISIVPGTDNLPMASYNTGRMAVTDVYGNVKFSGTFSLTGGQQRCATDASGNLYISTASTVTKINSDGTLAWTITTTVDSSGSIAVDASGNVYVSGQNPGGGSSPVDDGHQVSKYNASGTWQWTKGANGYEGNGTHWMRITSGGNIAFATNDYYTQYVTIINPSGVVVGGAAIGNQYGNIAGLACDSSGNTFASTMMYADIKGTIAKISSVGAVVWQIKYVGNYYGGVMCCDGSGNLYTLEYNTIIKYNSSGAITATLGFSGMNVMALHWQNNRLFMLGYGIIAIPDSLSVSGKYGPVTFSTGPIVTISTPSIWGGGGVVMNNVSNTVSAGSATFTSGFVPSITTAEIA